MTTRVLIADDELLARKRLTRLLTALPEVEVAGACEDGAEVLAFLERDPDVDVLLLDIHMPGLSGLEALSVLGDDGPTVIFCTAHADHALEAYERGAVDYVLKPVEAGRLKRALERATGRRRRGDAPSRLAVPTRRGVVLVDPQTVSHAVLDGELVVLVAGEQRLLTDFTLQELEDKLVGAAFERVHRRAIINLDLVDTLEPVGTGGYTARMRSGDLVNVSRAAARRLRRRFGL